MSQHNTVSQLDGLFKNAYGDQVENLIPDGVTLYNLVPFSPKEKMLGNLYNQPVILGSEQGFSYGGTAGDAFTLNNAIAGQVKNASVQGYEFLLRSSISYGSISRSMHSATAFKDATKLVVANMVKSFAKRIEVIMWHGTKGIGTVAAHSAGVITVTTAEWAPGIWSGSVAMQVELYDETATSSLAVAAISAVNLEGRTVTLLGADDPLTGPEQTAVDAALGTANVIRLWHKSARGNEFKGLHAIITEASSLFGINPSSFDLFKGVEYNAAGALSFSKIQKAISLGVAKGLDSDVMCFVNPRTWDNLMTDQAALRVYDSKYSVETLENGAKALTFYSQNGKVEIKSCIYIKEGQAFVVPNPKEHFLKIGSTDVTFRLPGGNDRFFRELDNAAGVELRAYSDLALFTAEPGKCILMYGIVNA